jgi:hypothetical protein
MNSQTDYGSINTGSASTAGVSKKRTGSGSTVGVGGMCTGSGSTVGVGK